MTVDPRMTVAEIAAAEPRAIPVFQKHGIDFCCGGKRPLEEVCAEKGLSFVELGAEIEALETTGAQDQPDWSRASFALLVRHILDRYHAGLRRDLPSLDLLLEKVLRAHGETHGESLQAMSSTFKALREELESHLEKEERVLFPYLLELEEACAGRRGAASISLGLASGVIGLMEREHGSAGLALVSLRRISGDYVPPPDACPSYRALYRGLAALEDDLHRHIHLENNVLFPRALVLESRLRAAG